MTTGFTSTRRSCSTDLQARRTDRSGSQLAEDTDGLDEYRSQITGPGQVPIGAHERVAAQGAGDDKAVFGQSGDLAACGCLSDPRPLGELTDRALVPRLGEEDGEDPQLLVRPEQWRQGGGPLAPRPRRTRR
jgi:hypothetical protein